MRKWIARDGSGGYVMFWGSKPTYVDESAEWKQKDCSNNYEEFCLEIFLKLCQIGNPPINLEPGEIREIKGRIVIPV